MAHKKLKFAFVSLTSCEGCYFELLGLREKFVALKDKIDIVDFRLFEDEEFRGTQKVDVVFVEGSPITKHNIRLLKQYRWQAKILVACGSCAHIGGIYHMKNYSDKSRLMAKVYDEDQNLDNPEVKPISEYVKVDFSLPTCPVIKKEILQFIYSLVAGKRPTIKQNPVCYECLKKGNKCLLQAGEICLGPIVQGGCDAICPTNGQACWGCRGLLRAPAIENWLNLLKEKGFTQSQINDVLKVFGIKEFMSPVKKQ